MTTDRVRIETAHWREPVAVAAGLAKQDWALCLLSDGGADGRWSYVAAAPDHTRITDTAADFTALRGTPDADPPSTDGPPFRGGTVGLAAYDMGARPATGERVHVWPDLHLARYPAVLAFDHHRHVIRVIGRGPTDAKADAALAAARSWLDTATTPPSPAPPTDRFDPDAPPAAYTDAVADVVDRIAAGDLFQANIARAWSGALNPGRDPFEVFLRLAGASPSPFAAFWRLPSRVLVSNSPELFVTVRNGEIETRPIKGTRPRDPEPANDAALAQALVASAKDRAENLMIVDLMRNDLSRVCAPGSVETTALFEVRSFPTVHHLVSTVRGRLAEGIEAADVLEATFPPGSITGAPKHQAMKVIAAHEPPRGPWCGSLFLAGDGGLTASVLIRTAAFQRTDDGWTWRAQAGAGIVADSEPQAELAETDAKISALRRALVGPDAD